jgi:hypothetical protein
MWNRAFFRRIRVRDGRIEDFTYEEPFTSLLGSHKGSIVDLRGHYSNSVKDLQALLRDCERLDDLGSLSRGRQEGKGRRAHLLP